MTKYRTIECIVLLSALAIGTGIRDEAAATPPAYHVTDLGTLGGTISLGEGINASGQVAGGACCSGAFLWTPTTPNGVTGTMHDLGTLDGTGSAAWDINDSGQVTGRSGNHASVWTPTTPNGDSGSWHDLGELGGGYSEAYGINTSGQVTGNSFAAGLGSRAFLWTPTTPNGASGTMINLGTLGGTGTYSNGNGINAAGQVTGASNPTGSFRHAFLWTPTTSNGASGTMHDLGTLLGGTVSEGLNINASGQVTGSSATTGSTTGHAFLWTPTTPGGASGTMIDLGTLGGTVSHGYGINASGQVTGNSNITIGDFTQHAFLYTSGSGMVDLNSLIDPSSGWELWVATSINGAGQITGWGQFGDQPNRAFLLTPVPEPATLALLALGLPLIVWRNSRRLRTDFSAFSAPLREIL